MTLTLDLPPEIERAYLAKATEKGVPVEVLVREVLLAQEPPLAPAEMEHGFGEEGKPQPFWKSFTRGIHALPAEVFENLPADGASEHDHYLYGSPKRNG
jgi:hypothetical protein